MLAYLFWHWPLTAAEPEAYEARLGDFHQALGAQAPEGFHGSMIYRHRGAPWVPEGGTAYEDWYLLDGFGALDTLNRAAVGGARREPHDRVARDAAGGAGGIYRIRHGRPGDRRMTHAYWFAKPAGMAYGDLYEAIAGRWEEGEIELWERQMVLGPAPEFCLVARHLLSLPEGVDARLIERMPIGVGSR